MVKTENCDKFVRFFMKLIFTSIFTPSDPRGSLTKGVLVAKAASVYTGHMPVMGEWSVIRECCKV